MPHSMASSFGSGCQASHNDSPARGKAVTKVKAQRAEADLIIRDLLLRSPGISGDSDYYEVHFTLDSAQSHDTLVKKMAARKQKNDAINWVI